MDYRTLRYRIPSLGNKERDVGGLARLVGSPYRQLRVGAHLRVRAWELHCGHDPRFGGDLPGNKWVDGFGRGDPLRPQIVIEVFSPGSGRSGPGHPAKNAEAFPQWALKHLDTDLAYAAAIVKS